MSLLEPVGRHADLVDAVSETLELLNTPARLLERVVPCADGAHAGGLVPRVALCAVLEVGVGPAGAVAVVRCGLIRERWSRERGDTYTQMLPVIAMCGHLCGLHITATTAIYGL